MPHGIPTDEVGQFQHDVEIDRIDDAAREALAKRIGIPNPDLSQNYANMYREGFRAGWQAAKEDSE